LHCSMRLITWMAFCLWMIGGDMEDWQHKLVMLSQAEAVRAMGMVAENKRREMAGEPLLYGDVDFNQVAHQTEQSAHEITNR